MTRQPLTRSDLRELARDLGLNSHEFPPTIIQLMENVAAEATSPLLGEIREQEAEIKRLNALKTLLSRCKCGVYLTVNQHRDYYLSAQQWLDDADFDAYKGSADISEEVRAGILSTGNVVEVTFYPDTPVGSYTIVHYDLDEALRLALEALNLN